MHVKVAWSEGTCREWARSGMRICGGERVGTRSASTFFGRVGQMYPNNDKIEKPSLISGASVESAFWTGKS